MICEGGTNCQESNVGGEDEQNCEFPSDYSDSVQSVFFDSDPGSINFDEFVDVGREIPGLENFVDVGTEPPQTFQDPSFSEQPVAPSFQSGVQEDAGPVSLEDMCQVSTGQSNIVLDMFESFGDDFSQATNPVELPVVGVPGRDVQLELVFPTGNTIFR